MFTRMEWWNNPNQDGLGQAVAGFTKEGDIFLTFDLRNKEGDLIPVFSHICKVGSSGGHSLKAYQFYREQFNTLNGYSIFPMETCNYTLKENPNINIKFREK